MRSELLGLESRAYAQLGGNETGNADRPAQTYVAVYDEAPRYSTARKASHSWRLTTAVNSWVSPSA